MTEDDIVLAGEFVLGLLDAATEASAVARVATDATFASEVEAWRLRLQPMVDGNETPAPVKLWPKIEAALPKQSGQDGPTGNVRLWQSLTGFSSVAAAILGVLLLQKPEVVAPPAQQAPLIAALGSETGTASLTASYEADSGRMIVTPVSLDTGELYPELWIIPADGTPHSLGIVASDKATSKTVPLEARQFMGSGGTLAITPEPQTGGAGGKPTGPVIASGKITTL
jgi:anti-sigma-K factor RskA